ncbi:MAG: hypothetical protein ACKO1X_07110 [Acidimicrobiales bacterium]
MALAERLIPVLVPDGTPDLQLVPRRNRRSVRISTVVAVVIGSLFAVVLLRTHMAQQQLRLDRLNVDIVRARNNFDRLRAERARFQSPAYLNERARAMGMVQGLDTNMVNIPTDIAVLVASGVGKVDSDVKSDRTTHLDEFGRMKRTVTAP